MRVNVKKTARILHLWLGVPCSIIIFLICISGSMFVFSDEIINFTDRGISRVEPAGNSVSADKMMQTVKEAYPGCILLNCVIYKEREKAALFSVGSRATGMFYVYVNPYTGAITGQSRVIGFFSKIAHFHKQLLLKKYGGWIVLVVSVFFIIELVTGLIMLRPGKRSGKYFANLLKIKCDASFLRRMIDLHRVLGIYFIVVMFLLSVTGVALFFLPKQGIESGSHTDIIFDDNKRDPLPLSSIIDPLMKMSPDVAYVKTDLWNIPKTRNIQCIAGSSTGVVTFTGIPYQVDKYTGKIVRDSKFLHDLKMRNVFRKLHVGDWMGLLGKFITFMTGIAGAFLAFSGIIIWLKKRVKV